MSDSKFDESIVEDPTMVSEIEKWKNFGYMIAQSYDELKKDHEALRKETHKDKEIIIELKDKLNKQRDRSNDR